MPTRDIPTPPDFAALEAAAAEGAKDREHLMTSIGALSVAWSNTESILIYVMMVLLRTDDIAAALVYGTLNTARARSNLVTRLMQLRLDDDDLRAELEGLLKEMEACGRLRNDLQHAAYEFDAAGRPVRTRSMRAELSGKSLRFGRTRDIDPGRLEHIARTIKRLGEVNHALWDVLPRLESHVRKEVPQKN